MKERDNQYLKMLKKKIALTMKQFYPGISSNIREWKGQDIIDFQEELLKKVNEHISEKWFYTHMKSENEKLPRIDILNFLSRYTGYKNWNDFKYKNKKNISFSPDRYELKKASPYLKIFGLLFFVVVSILLINTLSNNKYQFYFADAYTKKKIVNGLMEIIILNTNESPIQKKCDQKGFFTLKTKKQKVRFIIKAPYYKTDTITRILDKHENTEKIYLYPNDFALMIHYFSVANVENWEKRRAQLEEMIADNAYIFQVFGKDLVGMELYNKQEFINKLTMPVNSLKNIDIIETIYTKNKISLLRFRQLKDE